MAAIDCLRDFANFAICAQPTLVQTAAFGILGSNRTCGDAARSDQVWRAAVRDEADIDLSEINARFGCCASGCGGRFNLEQ